MSQRIPKGPAHVLVADDDESIRWVLQRALEDAGHTVVAAPDGTSALALLREQSFDVALLDVRMPGYTGFELLEQALLLALPPQVILLTAQDSVRNAIEAMKQGAYDYIAKPFDIEEIEILIARAFQSQWLTREVTRLSTGPAREIDAHELGMVGQSRAMREVFKIIGRVAPTEETVLISGESGTGKELVARAIHTHSRRASGPFVAVNCAAIPSELMESELFGYVKGAFTGAFGDRAGKLDAARGGTLFLDEIGDLPIELQAKLLRVLQSKEYTPVGSERTQKFEARVLAATNHRLEDLVHIGRFRRDLFYRLNVVEIALPSLAERAQDIPRLITHFLQRAAFEAGVAPKGIAPEVMAQLCSREWPGNVRELENAIRRAVVMGRGTTLMSEDFSEAEITSTGRRALTNDESFESQVTRYLTSFVPQMADSGARNLRSTVLAMVDRPLIRLALHHTGGNKVRAAELLGVNRNTLHTRMQELGMEAKKKV